MGNISQSSRRSAEKLFDVYFKHEKSINRRSMEFKGTQGNWNEIYHNGCFKIISDQNVLVAECDHIDRYYTCPTKEGIKANARLIASAPDLLEALQEVQEFLGHIEPKVGEAAFQTIWDEVDSAIKKALGE